MAVHTALSRRENRWIRAQPVRRSAVSAYIFAAVAHAYDELAAAEPDRFATIDAAQAPQAVLAGCLAALEPLLQPGSTDHRG